MVLFSIPIYNWSKEKHQKECDNLRQKYSKYNHSEKEISNHLNELYPNYYVWKNTIVGFLDVVYNRGEIVYHLYEMRSKKYLSKKTLNKILLNIENMPLSEEEKEIERMRTEQSYSLVPYKMPSLYTNRKHYMGFEQVAGMHTQINNLSNEEIADEIKNDIDLIIKYDLAERHVDLEQFLNLYKAIDYKKVFASHARKSNE